MPEAVTFSPELGCAQDWGGLAKNAMAERDHGKAERYWRKALEANPYSATSHFGLGSSLYGQAKIEAAISCYRAALENDPDLFGARVSLAIAYLSADCPLLALREAELALFVHPDTIDLRFVRASALIKLDRPQEAISDLAWLYAQKAPLRDLALLECEANLALGEYEAALVLCAEICEAQPTFAPALSSFRQIFRAFIATAAPARVSEFLDGLGLARRPPTPHAPPAPAKLASARACIDVIIPVHNALDHLRDCLESLRQNPSPLLHKIILVDDGSAPLTRERMRRLARKDRQIALYRSRKAGGFTRAVARGLAPSKTPYAVVLNSDCIVGAGWLEKLYAAMTAGDRVAMVGPITNNGAWQSLGEPLDETGNFATHAMVEAAQIGTLNRQLSLLKAFGPADTMLIHGFCVLIDRQAYQALGGLDAGAFAQGYGEFQDLSLRAIAAGYHLRIADDCFIAHQRGASLPSDQRTNLSRKARQTLYQRYSALHYLTAECCALENPQIQLLRDRTNALNLYAGGPVDICENAAQFSVLAPDLPPVPPDFTGRKICLFVAFAPKGGLLPYTTHYLQSLQSEGYEVVLLLNVEQGGKPAPDLGAYARHIIMRENIGYDFGAWADAFAHMPSLWQAEMILFTNDSILGPFTSLSPILRRIESSTASYISLTESHFCQKHAQSFFWVLKQKALAMPALKSLIESIHNTKSKTQAIFLYEVFLRKICVDLLGLEYLCLFPFDGLTGTDSDIRPSQNPTHHLWRELMRAGFPFLKGDFCRKNASGADARAWHAEVKAQGGDVLLAQLHVEEARLQRSPPSP